MISLKQLSYAVAVRKTLHFRKAAELCNISQSAVSLGLTDLERRLGVQIFERDNKKVLITPIGEQVLEHAEQILLKVEDLMQVGAQDQHALSFPLRIGFIPTIAPYLLAKMLPAMQQDYPDFKMSVDEALSQVLVDEVRSGEIDAAVLALPYDCEGLLSFTFWEENFYWVTHKSDPLSRRKSIGRKEIEPNKLMLLQEGHCLKAQILDVCKLSKEATGVGSFSASSLTTLVELVAAGYGSTLVPALALPALRTQHPQIKAVRLDEPAPHRRLAFILRPNYPRLDAIEVLMDICRTALSNNEM